MVEKGKSDFSPILFLCHSFPGMETTWFPPSLVLFFLRSFNSSEFRALVSFLPARTVILYTLKAGDTALPQLKAGRCLETPPVPQQDALGNSSTVPPAGAPLLFHVGCLLVENLGISPAFRIASAELMC